jgi:hypothetical protein
VAIEVTQTCLQSRQDVINNYFMEHRSKLIDIAAYLDRIDRATGELTQDFRQEAFLAAIKLLLSDGPHRTKRILELFSVTDPHLPQSAEGMKGAVGAVSPSSGATR